MMTPQEYLHKVAAGQNAENEQSRNDGRASNQERSDANTYDGISGRRDPRKTSK